MWRDITYDLYLTDLIFTDLVEVEIILQFDKRFSQNKIDNIQLKLVEKVNDR